MAAKMQLLNSDNSVSTTRLFIPLALLSLLIFPIYANILNASWQMDDKPNIVDNTRLHIDNLMPSTLYKTFFASPGSIKKLYRPIPCLTFALNWYLGKDDPTGYHIVNIFIHIFTSFILFMSVLVLFQTPALKGKYTARDAYFISLLSAVLWAINPIQTQAVTYIVQRMTSMAALFYLLGLFFYIKARTSRITLTRIFLYLGCLISFFFALGSKENTATFPLALALLEVAFFQHSWRTKAQTPFFRIATWVGICLFIVLILVYTKGNLLFFMGAYEHRSFSLLERLLAEPRVVVFYLSQIFYPLPSRLSIDHSIPLSTSLTDPWTIIPSLLIIFSLILIGVFQLKKRPVLGFAILFFFLNHIIESTVIPLEIIFEHRNYLPSAFLFFPIALGSHWILSLYKKKNRLIFSSIFAVLTFLIIVLGLGTYTRNMAWATKRTLWSDAMAKAPENVRPLNVLAIDLGWDKNATPNDLNKAIALSYKSLSLYMPNKFQAVDILGNIANLYRKKGEIEKSIQYYEQVLKIDPLFIKVRFELAQSLILTQRWKEASRHLNFVINKGSLNSDYFNLKGFVLLWQDRPEEALPYLRQALSISPNKGGVLLNMGVALSRAGSYQNAEWFLKRASRTFPKDIIPLFVLIENRIRANDIIGAKVYTKKLLTIHSLQVIRKNLAERSKNFSFAPVSKGLITPLIKETAIEMLENVWNKTDKTTAFKTE